MASFRYKFRRSIKNIRLKLHKFIQNLRMLLGSNSFWIAVCLLVSAVLTNLDQQFLINYPVVRYAVTPSIALVAVIIKMLQNQKEINKVDSK